MSRIAPRRGGLVARFSNWYARRSLGKAPTPVAVTAHSPWLLRGYVAFEYGLERAHATERRLLELAQLKAAAAVGCEYCMDIGSAVAAHAGVTEEQIRDLHRHAESGRFSAEEKVVLDYAAAMSRTPVDVSDALFDELHGRFSEEQIVELTAAIAWENYRARFNWALDIEPQGFARGACAVSEHAPAATSV